MTEKKETVKKVVKEPAKKMSLEEKLLNIQCELKAPKGQFNAYGKYKYRSCEDILEALKPLLKKYRLLQFFEDTPVIIGERHYIEVKLNVDDLDSDKLFMVKAYAREEKDKKGMDGSQITGAASSYARKYALNAMYLIDDMKDSDTTNKGEKQVKVAKKAEKLVSTQDMKDIVPLLQNINNATTQEELDKVSELIKTGAKTKDLTDTKLKVLRQAWESKNSKLKRK